MLNEEGATPSLHSTLEMTCLKYIYKSLFLTKRTDSRKTLNVTTFYRVSIPLRVLGVF